MPLTSQVLIWKHNVDVKEAKKVWFLVKATKIKPIIPRLVKMCIGVYYFMYCRFR
jgi:hypothetical protein